MRMQLTINDAAGERVLATEEASVRLGTDALCDVRFDAARDACVAALHARIQRVDGHFEAEALQGSALYVGGQRVEKLRLEDGMVLHLGLTGPQVCFRVLRTRRPGRTFTEIVGDVTQSTQGQRSRAMRAVGIGTQVLRQSLMYGTRRLRFAVVGLSVLVVGLVVMLMLESNARREGEARTEDALREGEARIARALKESQGLSETERVRNAERRAASMEAELVIERERFAKALGELGASFAQQSQNLASSLEAAAQRASKAEGRLESLEKLSAVAKDLHQRFAGSVGIMEIGVSFYSPKEQAFVRFASGQGGKPIAGGSGPLVLGGSGARYIEWHSGTAFLVSDDGLVASNRHVIDPWFDDDDFGEGLLALGCRPVREQFLFCFAGQQEVLTATRIGAHPNLDVALAKLSKVPAGLLPLPLAPTNHALRVGSELFIVGFPLGLEGLFTKLESAKLKKLYATSFADAGVVLREIAGMNGVQPTLNGGVLSNFGDEQLIYDASTTHGASGSPLFDETGAVVGVNRAITRFGGANIGVPVAALRTLLAAAPEPMPSPEIATDLAVEAPAPVQAAPVPPVK